MPNRYFTEAEREHYNEIRPLMKTGDLLQWKTNSVLGSLIRLRTKSDVNHSSLIIRLAEYEGLERRVFNAEAMEGAGVAPNLLSRRLGEYDGKVYLYRLKPEFDDARQKIGEMAFYYFGIEYDYHSLLAQAISKVSVDAKAFFCSEYCYFCYGMAGILPIGWEKRKAPNPGEMPELELFMDKIEVS